MRAAPCRPHRITLLASPGLPLVVVPALALLLALIPLPWGASLTHPGSPFPVTVPGGAQQSGDLAAAPAAGPLVAAVSPATGTSTDGYLWTNLSGSLPMSPSGRLTTMAWDPTDGYVLLFGGTIQSGAALADTWSFGNGSWTNLTSELTGAPPALDGAALAFDSTSGDMILYGAVAPGNAVAVTWSYHDKVWTNLTGTAGTEPSPRSYEAFTPDSTDGGILLFGGRPDLPIGPLVDTWSFESGHWTNLTATAGWAYGGLGTPTGADDPPDHGVLMFGYYLLNATRSGPGTYLYSGGNWRNLSSTLPTEPPASVWARAGYVPELHSVLMFEQDFINKVGGLGPFPAIYAYAAGAWSNLTLEVAGPPSVGYSPATTIIGSDSAFLAFGGELLAGGYTSHTWVLSGLPAASASSSRSMVDAGGAVTLASIASGGVAPYTYHWTLGDGTNSSDAGPGVTYASAGLYTATLTLTDLVGRTASASVAIEVNPSLSASAVLLPSPGTVGAPVGFVAQVSGGTPPYAYHWALGDAATSTAASGTHTYAKAGNYTVNLTITDAAGASSSSSVGIEVTSAPSTAPTAPSGSPSASLTSGVGLYLLIGVIALAVIAAALGGLLARRPKPPPPPSSSYSSGPPAGAASGGMSPYGSGPPPPPGGSPPAAPR
jgi:PKD repeat protein